MEFLLAMGYLFIMFPVLSLVVILFTLIVFSLTVVFSVSGYYKYIKEQEKNIVLIKNVYVISILLGCFYFVSLFFKNNEMDLFDWLNIFTFFMLQTMLVSFLIAILSYTIKTKKYLSCLFLVISTMLLAFVYPVAIFIFVLLDFVIRKLMSKSDIEKLKKMLFY